MLASRYGQVQCLRLLAEHICSDPKQTPDFVDLKNYDNKSATDLAVESDHFECVHILKALKSRLNERREQQSGAQVVANNSLSNNLMTNKLSISDSFKLNNNFVGLQSLESNSSSAAKTQTKSHERLFQSEAKLVNKNGVKLPPINGKRFVEYNDWNKQNNVINDRKTI